MKKLWNMHELVKHASDHTGLSPALCKEMLEKGWTLVFKINEAHTWVSPIQQVTVPTVEEVTSHGVKVKDKDNEQEKQLQSAGSINRTVRDFMGTHGVLGSGTHGLVDVNTTITNINVTPQGRADILNAEHIRNRARLAR